MSLKISSISLINERTNVNIFMFAIVKFIRHPICSSLPSWRPFVDHVAKLGDSRPFIDCVSIMKGKWRDRPVGQCRSVVYITRVILYIHRAQFRTRHDLRRLRDRLLKICLDILFTIVLRRLTTECRRANGHVMKHVQLHMDTGFLGTKLTKLTYLAWCRAQNA